MKIKFLFLNVIFAVYGYADVYSVNNPEFIRCNEDERRSVRLGFNTADTLTTSGAILSKDTGMANIAAIISCAHGSVDVINDVYGDKSRCFKFSTTESRIFPMLANGGLHSDYRCALIDYISRIQRSTSDLGNMIVDSYIRKVGGVVFGNIKTSKPATWRLTDTVSTVKFNPGFVPVDIAISYASKSANNRIQVAPVDINQAAVARLSHDVVDVTVYGNPSNNVEEYRFTIPCKLSNDGRWLHSTDFVSQKFSEKIFGMSGGPCFINGAEFCGVLSGCSLAIGDPGMQLHIKTVPDEFINLVNSWR